jgi:hypothetical protein
MAQEQVRQGKELKAEIAAMRMKIEMIQDQLKNTAEPRLVEIDIGSKALSDFWQRGLGVLAYGAWFMYIIRG